MAREAVSAAPSDLSLEQVLRQAHDFIAARRWEQARDVLSGQLDQGSGDTRIHEALGAIAGQLQDHVLAAKHFGVVARADPSQASHFHNLGEALRHQRRFDEAQAALQQALQLQPLMVQSYESLIQIAYVGYGQALVEQNVQRKALLEGELATLYNHLGNALLAHGGQAQALAAYRQACVYAPRRATILSNLGNVLCTAGQISEAESMCREAIAENPNLPAAWNNLGDALVNSRRYAEAQSCFERALSLRPDCAEAKHNLLSGLLLDALMCPQTSDEQLAAASRRYLDDLPRPSAPTPRRWDGQRRLRIGYLSADFRQHAMMHFLMPVLANHRRDQFEIICYAQGPGIDDWTHRFMALGHSWVWVHALSDEQLDAKIRADQLDILVDCIGHTRGCRLAALARKPAQIMLSWLGYLGSTFLPAMDARLTDEWLDPLQAHSPPMGEPVLRITAGMCAYRPHLNPPAVSELAARRNGYITFGSLSNSRKLNRELVRVWAQILLAVPSSRLILKSKALVDAAARAWLLGLFEAHGIEPQRLDLRMASADFLHTYHEIDIALDSFPYGGGATTCDALWMGVPVICLAGQRPAGRLSVSILHRVGRAQWVATTSATYVNLACALAGNIEELEVERARLRDLVQNSPLCDEVSFVQNLEQTYQTLAAKVDMPDF